VTPDQLKFNKALAEGRFAFYTAPIKALVSEKFFALVEIFGAENVGMMTGDSSVNSDAPIICCTAEILANHPWPRLYDADVLRRNEVPVAATIYINDLYVERTFAQETAETIGGLKAWVTDEFEHNGLRADGERVLGTLLDMVRGRA